jgi:hypothetical protein
LQIRELEDRKKVATLLSISGLTESEGSYFMKEPPAKAVIPQKLPKKLQNEMAASKNNTGIHRSFFCKQLETLLCVFCSQRPQREEVRHSESAGVSRGGGLQERQPDALPSG